MALAVVNAIIATNGSSATAALTSGSFTPPIGALLLPLWAGNSVTGVNPTPQPVITYTQTVANATQDWQSRADAPNANGQAAAWRAFVGLATSMTVTVTNNAASGAREAALGIPIITGVQFSKPMGLHGKSGSLSATTVSQQYVAQANGSMGFLAVCDWTANGTMTAGAGMTVISSGTVGVGLSYGFFRRTDPDGVLGQQTSLDCTIPGTSTNLSYVWVEVLPDNPVPVRRNPYGPRRWLGKLPLVNSRRFVETVTTTVTADSGTASGGLSATAGAAKTAPTSGRDSVGLSARVVGVKVVAVTGSSSLGLSAVGAGRKVTPRQGTSSAGLSARSAELKVARPVGSASLGLSSVVAQTQVATPVARGPVGLSARAVGVRVGVVSGRASLGLAGSGSGRKVVATLSPRASAGLAARADVRRVAGGAGSSALGLSGRVSDAKVALPASRAAAGLSGTGAPRHTVGLSGTSSAGLSARGTLQKPTPFAAMGLSARATVRKTATPTARCSLGLAGQATGRKAAVETVRAGIGLVGRATARHVGLSSGRGALGLAGQGLALHRGAVAGRSALGLAAWQFVAQFPTQMISPPGIASGEAWGTPTVGVLAPDGCICVDLPVGSGFGIPTVIMLEGDAEEVPVIAGGVGYPTVTLLA